MIPSDPNQAAAQTLAQGGRLHLPSKRMEVQSSTATKQPSEKHKKNNENLEIMFLDPPLRKTLDLFRFFTKTNAVLFFYEQTSAKIGTTFPLFHPRKNLHFAKRRKKDPQVPKNSKTTNPTYPTNRSVGTFHSPTFSVAPQVPPARMVLVEAKNLPRLAVLGPPFADFFRSLG